MTKQMIEKEMVEMVIEKYEVRTMANVFSVV